VTNAPEPCVDAANFLPGPHYSSTPDFGEALSSFLDDANSEPLQAFGAHWLKASQDRQLPTWRSLRIHSRPDLVANTLLISWPNGSDRKYVRFVGCDIIENQGADYTNFAFDEIDKGYVFHRWNDGTAYCIENRALSVIRFDLAFSGRSLKKAISYMFPLGPDGDERHLCGYTLWAN